ncbi:MAG TPA: OB-fold nucleic acid binding domain-containing protein [Pyrinomonadaceae bacterium]|nr:OB-fold nucleic acid binding domain-containing protein [Pyrinomonadaceae bacterium]
MRRAMGKKDQKAMAPHEVKFIEGAVGRGIDKKKAKAIFDLMAKFADYGFNRSHSIAYAYVAYQTAYLKAHYPAYFYAAVLSHEADDSAKVYKYSNELRSLGLSLLPPDVNESDEGFTPGDGSVRFGLSAIKGMGAAAAKAIIEAREGGRFNSLYDFVSRVDHTAINRKSVESLAAAGAFDSMKPDDLPANLWRAKIYSAIDDALAFGQNAWNDKLRGQSGLFGGASESAADHSLPNAETWTQAEMSAKEKVSLGFYLSAHPLDDYQEILKGLGIRAIADHDTVINGQQMLVAGVVSGLQVRWSKKGNRFASFQIEDQSTSLKCLMWGDEFGKYADAIENDQLLIVEGKIKSNDGQDMILMSTGVRSLTEAVSKNARAVKITLPEGDYDEAYFQDLCSVLSSSPGRCEVHIRFPIGEVVTELRSGPMRVEGSRRLEKELEQRGCSVNWIL